LTYNYQILQDDTRGEGHISSASATPLPQGGVAQAQSNFGVFLLFMHTPFDANYQI